MCIKKGKIKLRRIYATMRSRHGSRYIQPSVKISFTYAGVLPTLTGQVIYIFFESNKKVVCHCGSCISNAIFLLGFVVLGNVGKKKNSIVCLISALDVSTIPFIIRFFNSVYLIIVNRQNCRIGKFCTSV